MHRFTLGSRWFRKSAISSVLFLQEDMLAFLSLPTPSGAVSIPRAASSDANRIMLSRGVLLIVLGAILGVGGAAAGFHPAGGIGERVADASVVVQAHRGHDGSPSAFWLTRSAPLLDAETERGGELPPPGSAQDREDGGPPEDLMQGDPPALASRETARALPIYLLQRVFRL